MPEPRPVQLVLQGGGAKLFALIAALEGLHKAVNDGRIVIRRIAATLAGAIVGSLYAAGISPAALRAEFAAFPLDQLMPFQGRWRKGRSLWRALRGLPLVDDRPLSELLSRLLRDQLDLARPALLGDLAIPMVIVASDVSGRQRIDYDSERPADRERRVVSCVMDSCAIPFFFRAAGRDSQTLLLDGGLCENLPTDLLSPEIARYGEIVAISFLDEEPATPRSPKEFAVALLDTAINASVRRSKAAANIVLIELNPYGVGTFDFDKAHSALSRTGPDVSKYDNARDLTEKRIREFHTAQGKRWVSKSRWENADPTTMGQLFRIYKSQQTPRLFRYFSRRLVIEANSLLLEGEDDHGTRDLIVQMLEFAPSRHPVDCLAAQIFTDPGQKPSDISCDVSDSNGVSVPFQPVPVRDPDNERMYGLLIFFTPPLEPFSQNRYFLRTEFRVGEAFSDLKTHGIDYMGLTILRAEGGVDRVDLVAHIPKSFGEVEVSSDPEPSVRAQPINPQDLWGLQGRGHFRVHGWRAEDVPQGGVVRIVLRKS